MIRASSEGSMNRTPRALTSALVLVGLFSLVGMAPPPPGADPEKDLKKAAKASDTPGMVAAIEAMRPATKDQVKLMLDVGGTLGNPEVYVKCKDSLATATGDAREELCKQLEHAHRIEARVLCADALGSAQDDDAARALATALDDEVLPVRVTAIRSLARLQRHACVDALVARLQAVDVSQGGSEVEELFRALLQLTGQALEAPADWKAWWSTQPAEYDPKTRNRPAGGDSAGTRTRDAGKIFETAVVSRAFVLILDISSSMRVIDMPPGEQWTDPKGVAHAFKDPGMGAPDENSRFMRAKREFTQFINGLTPQTRFAIVAFGDDARAWKDQLVPATDANKAQAVAFVQGLTWQPATVTDAALERAFAIPGADTFYLFSDGIPERRVNGANTDIPQDAVIAKAQQLNLTRKARLHCYGFATASETTRAFLRRLAQTNDGEYKDIR
jgi:hypothetical protein